MNSSTTRQCVARRSRNQRGRKPDSTQRTLRLARSTAESFSFATLGGDLCDLGVKSERRSRSGERTPPACQFGRRARTIVTPSSCAWRWEEVCGTRFSARRRKPHVRGVCSPELGAASSFDFGVRVNPERRSWDGVGSVGQAFQPAGASDFPVARHGTGKFREPADKNVCPTSSWLCASQANLRFQT